MSLLLRDMVRVRPEVLKGEVKPAVDLGVIAARILYNEKMVDWQSDPGEFLSRTYVTEGMRKTLLTVFAALSAKPQFEVHDRAEIAARIVVLPSLLGGGKTHLLGFLLYTLQLIREGRTQDLEKIDPVVGEAAALLENYIDSSEVRIAVVAGDTERFAPRPGKPVKTPMGWSAQTLWGYILGLLGVPVEKWRYYDEKLEVPGKDVLRDLLGEKPVLIVIDEVTTYASSIRPEYRESLVSFLKNLFEAIDTLPRAVAIVTLPAEVRGDELAQSEHEVTLPSGERLVALVYKMAQRVTHKVIKPIDMEQEIHKVLKKRLLANTEKELAEAARRIVEAYKLHMTEDLRKAIVGLRGSVDGFLHDIEEYYPFHPQYIRILYDIGAYIPGFGRTRSLIQLTVSVLMNIDKLESSLVMPWHINVEDGAIRARLLARHNRREYYEKVILEDIQRIKEIFRERSKELDLSRKILYIVWLYSIALGTMLNIEMMIRRAPSKDILPAYILEPILMEKRYLAADIINVIEDMLIAAPLWIIESEGKLLYPILPDLENSIKSRFFTIGDEALYRILEELEPNLRTPGEKIKNVYVVTRAFRTTIESLKAQIRRTEDPVLVIVLDPLADKDLLKELLLRNNVFLLLAKLKEKISEGTVLDGLRRKISGKYPYVSSKDIITIEDLATIHARLIDAIKSVINELPHMDIENIIRKNARTKLERQESELKADLSRILLLSMTELVAGVNGKESRRVDLMDYTVPTDSSSDSYLTTLVSRLENYMVRTLGYIDKLRYSELVTIASSLGKTEKTTVDGREELIIGDEWSINDIWRYLVSSTDPSIKPNLLSKKSFVESIIDIYRGEDEILPYDEHRIAFITDSDKNPIIWLNIIEIKENEEICSMSMIVDPLYNKDGLRELLSQTFNVGNEALLEDLLLRLRIIHPVKIVEKYVEYLLAEESKIIRKGDVEVRRKYFVIDCSRSQPEIKELHRLYDSIRGNPILLYKQLKNHRVGYTETVLEKSYQAELIEPKETEFNVEAGGVKYLNFKIRVTSNDYPHPIKVIVKVLDKIVNTELTHLNVSSTTNEEKQKQIDKIVEIKAPIPENPGSYAYEITTIGFHPSDNKEFRIASVHVNVRGEKCDTVLTNLAEIQNITTDAEHVGIKGITTDYRQTITLGALNNLSKLLKSSIKYRPIVDITAEIRRGNGSLSISANKVDVKAAGNLLNIVRTLLQERDTITQINKISVSLDFSELISLEESKSLIEIVEQLGESTQIKLYKCVKII